MNPATPGRQNPMGRCSSASSSFFSSRSSFVLLPDQHSSRTFQDSGLLFIGFFFFPSLVCAVGFAAFFCCWLFWTETKLSQSLVSADFSDYVGANVLFNLAPGPKKCHWLYCQWAPHAKNTLSGPSVSKNICHITAMWWRAAGIRPASIWFLLSAEQSRIYLQNLKKRRK